MLLHEQRSPGISGSSGMTLLELLVVVAILAVLATVAIQSTSEIGDQTRFEASQKSVSAFRAAVLGPDGQVAPDGSPIASGFLSDIGRLPRVSTILDADFNDQGGLPELYSETLPAGLRPYAVWTVGSANTTAVTAPVPPATFNALNTNEVFASYGNLAAGFIRVPAGWRGPYIRKPSSSYTLLDGWQKPLVSRWELGTSVAEIPIWPSMLLEFRTNLTTYGYGSSQLYTPILSSGRECSGIMTTSGFEGAPNAAGVYSSVFESLISQNDVRNDLVVQVVTPAGKYSTTSNFQLLLMVYGPNPNVASDNRPLFVYAQQATYTSAQFQFTLSGLMAPTAGLRVFRAVLNINPTASTYSHANYVRSPPIAVPITRLTQSVNISIP
jgi:prepilin-type N-terminal cleavage/methylation domain-containing protein